MQTIHGTVERIETGVLSPAEIQKRYGSGNGISQVITGPSIVISLKPDAPFLSRSYEGSIFALYFILQPLLRARSLALLVSSVFIIANIGTDHIFGTQANGFFLVNDVVILLVINRYPQERTMRQYLQQG